MSVACLGFTAPPDTSSQSLVVADVNDGELSEQPQSPPDYIDVRLRSVQELCGLAEALSSGSDAAARARLMTSLVVQIESPDQIPPAALHECKIALAQILHHAQQLKELAIHSSPEDVLRWTPRGYAPVCEHICDLIHRVDGFDFLPLLAILDVPAHFVQSLYVPHPSITHLSVHVRHEFAEETYHDISRLFGPTLVSLRIRRTFEVHCTLDSPARICAIVKAYRLRYLEVVDTSILPAYPVGHGDTVRGTAIHAACLATTSSLQTLVWRPIWSQALGTATSTIQAFRSSLSYYHNDLRVVFDLQALEIMLRGNLCFRYPGDIARSGIVMFETVSQRESRWKEI
ncbi:hypothetical protein OH77DRAFT_1524465 [Trametes cingulata]|nr:hypothetical protein OH77DRAFT_1524465 [Trametes cingulata]